ILDGEKAQGLRSKEATSCAYMFDWRQLKRWGIHEENLPSGSVIRFREPAFWDLYWWRIVGVLALCVIQAVLILGLLVQRARRQPAEKERAEASKTREELRRELAPASRLALAGELTASIAHEINQPLGAILSNADAAEMLLESDPGSLAEVHKILEDIRKD